MLIENYEGFFSELTKLFNQNQSNGSSLFITMKRYDGRTKPLPVKKSSPDYKPKRKPKAKLDSTAGQDGNKCLIRAQIGNKKISTVVAAKDINKFQVAYSSLLKGNLYGLKKKDKKKAGNAAAGSGKATQ
ncbi:Signal recognition particle 14 kDa protein [Halotydeus destructor]|nr:Signal recognition particle 14 kDa protein [Halotydeus destructor]